MSGSRMTRNGTVSGWAKGANNISPKNAIPDGFVRHAVNVDASPTGILTMSSGMEKIYEGTEVRGVLSLDGKLLVADGTSLVLVDAMSGVSSVIRTIDPSGPFVGAVMNSTLYFCTQTECLEFDGMTVRDWGVPDVNNQPLLSEGVGTLAAGFYQVAMTYTDQWGREGGTDRPVLRYYTEGTGLVVSVSNIPAGCTANIYVSPIDASTLYLQARTTTAGDVEIGTPRDDTAVCNTILLRAPRPSDHIAVHNAVICMARGTLLEMTMPMQAHLVNRAKNFFQYSAPIGAVMSDNKVLFVSADKCYALAESETNSVEQAVVLEFPAMAGTAVNLPDGRVSWMTRYGQAISSEGGRLELVTKDAFAPSNAPSGAAGVVDHNGNHLIVTTTRGKHTGNPLAASDFYIGEILNP